MFTTFFTSGQITISSPAGNAQAISAWLTKNGESFTTTEQDYGDYLVEFCISNPSVALRSTLRTRPTKEVNDLRGIASYRKLIGNRWVVATSEAAGLCLYTEDSESLAAIERFLEVSGLEAQAISAMAGRYNGYQIAKGQPQYEEFSKLFFSHPWESWS